jgi:L-ribulokinase
MTGVKKQVFTPNPAAHAVYQGIYPLYRKLHDALGTKEWNGNLYDVMKKLLDIRAKVRK